MRKMTEEAFDMRCWLSVTPLHKLYFIIILMMGVRCFSHDANHRRHQIRLDLLSTHISVLLSQ